MRKILLALAAIALVVGCQSPTTQAPVITVPTYPPVDTPPPSPPVDTPPPSTTPAKTLVVVNSLWKTVTPTLSRSERSLTGSDLVAYVENYNATTFDDYLRIYDSDAVPALADAPNVSVFIVNPATYAVNASYENVARSILVENASGWRASAYGQLLFIDHVPPAPIATPPTSSYAYWAIYEIDPSGNVVYEDHCGYRADEQFYQVDIGDYPSVQVYYDYRLRTFQSDILDKPGYTVITRELYTPPVTP